jgi:hypothetical protein
MKTILGSILVFSLVFVLRGVAYGQATPTISYQGILNTSSGTPVADQSWSFTFRIYDASNTLLWTAHGRELWRA